MPVTAAMKGVLQDKCVNPGKIRGKKGRIHNKFIFHELQQYLPRIALFLHRFDDAEERFDLVNGHTLSTTTRRGREDDHVRGHRRAQPAQGNENQL